MRNFGLGMAALSVAACASVPNTYSEQLALEGCYGSVGADQRRLERIDSRVQPAADVYKKTCWPVSSTWYGADDSRNQQRANLAVSFPSEEPR